MTKFTKLLVGTGVTAAVLAGTWFIVGSQILRGNLIFDTTNNANPKIVVDVDAVVSFTGAGLNFLPNGTNSGANLLDDGVIADATDVVPCSGTGGRVEYNYCNWQEPSNGVGSGSIVDLIEIQFGNTPAAHGIDVTIGASATGSGATAVSNLTDIVGYTGGVLRYGSGGLTVPEGYYIRAVTLTDPTSSQTSRMIIHYRDNLTHD